VRDTAEKSRPCPVTLNTVVVSVTGFADLRYKFLRELHQRFPESLVVLILDHATIHTSRVSKQFLKKA
jgi:hypothetical protein